MALTLANFESVLVARCGAAMIRVSLDGTTVDGTNAALVDPIRTAIRALGYPVSDPVTPTDADLAGVPSVRYEQLYDHGERRTLETVLAHCTGVDEKVGQDEQRNSQFAAQLEKRIAALTDKITRGPGIASGGTVVTCIKAGYTRPGKPLPGDPRRWPNR